MPDGLRWSWCNNNKVHNKCNAFETPWNLSPNPSSWQNCFSLNWSLVPMRDLKCVIHGITEKNLSLPLSVFQLLSVDFCYHPLGSTPRAHHLVRCWARIAPGCVLQFSNEALAASTAAATSSLWACRQLAKFSPREMNGGTQLEGGGAFVRTRGGWHFWSPGVAQGSKAGPLPHSGSQFYHDKWG